MPSTSFFLERDEFIRRRSKRRISRMARIERKSLRNAASVHRRIATRRFGRDKMKPEVNGALAIKERYPGAVLIFPTTFPTCGAGSKGGGPNQRADRRAFRDRPPGSEVRAQLRLPDHQRTSSP
jgi:hypothetical protein